LSSMIYPSYDPDRNYQEKESIISTPDYHKVDYGSMLPSKIDLSNPPRVEDFEHDFDPKVRNYEFENEDTEDPMYKIKRDPKTTKRKPSNGSKSSDYGSESDSSRAYHSGKKKSESVSLSREEKKNIGTVSPRLTQLRSKKDDGQDAPDEIHKNSDNENSLTFEEVSNSPNSHTPKSVRESGNADMDLDSNVRFRTAEFEDSSDEDSDPNGNISGGKILTTSREAIRAMNMLHAFNLNAQQECHEALHKKDNLLEDLEKQLHLRTGPQESKELQDCIDECREKQMDLSFRLTRGTAELMTMREMVVRYRAEVNALLASNELLKRQNQFLENYRKTFRRHDFLWRQDWEDERNKLRSKAEDAETKMRCNYLHHWWETTKTVWGTILNQSSGIGASSLGDALAAASIQTFMQIDVESWILWGNRFVKEAVSRLTRARSIFAHSELAKRVYTLLFRRQRIWFCGKPLIVESGIFGMAFFALFTWNTITLLMYCTYRLPAVCFSLVKVFVTLLLIYPLRAGCKLILAIFRLILWSVRFACHRPSADHCIGSVIQISSAKSANPRPELKMTLTSKMSASRSNESKSGKNDPGLSAQRKASKFEKALDN